jgi:outer membrane receptor protein involved in Fe transport
VWRPSDAHVLKLLYGEAFRAPSPDEALSAYGSFTGVKDASGNYLGSGFRSPNFNLQPEKAKTLSLTWDWRPRADLNLVTNLYRSKIDNLIVTANETTPTQYIPGAILSKTTIKANSGEESHTGLDLSAQWRFMLGEDWDCDLRASYSWVNGEVQQGSNLQQYDLVYVADRKIKLGATFRYLDRFTISPQVLVIGDTNTGLKDAANPGDRIKSPGYTVTNLHLGWHKLLDGKATLWFDVYNLLDTRYYAAHGSASTTFVQMPQQPRTWMTGLEYHF